MKENALVIGADSLIGRKLLEKHKNAGQQAIGTTRRDTSVNGDKLFLDLTGDISCWIPSDGVNVAYLCAAITSLEECRLDQHRSRLVNVVNIIRLAELLIKRGIFVVFLSTSQVFDGSIPYRKIGDKLCPATEYGLQKAESERALLELSTNIAVVRITKVIAPEAPPLFKNWLATLQANEIIRPFSDMVFSPVLLDSLVDILYHLGQNRLRGIWHISGDSDITYAQAAYRLADYFRLDEALIQPVEAREAGFRGHLPQFTTLDAKSLSLEMNYTVPSVFKSLDSIFSKIGGQDA